MLQNKLHGRMADPAMPVVKKDHRQMRSTQLPVLSARSALSAIIWHRLEWFQLDARKRNHNAGTNQIAPEPLRRRSWPPGHNNRQMGYWSRHARRQPGRAGVRSIPVPRRRTEPGGPGAGDASVYICNPVPSTGLQSWCRPPLTWQQQLFLANTLNTGNL